MGQCIFPNSGDPRVCALCGRAVKGVLTGPIYARCRTDAPEERPQAPPPAAGNEGRPQGPALAPAGPGSMLQALLAAIGLRDWHGCRCDELVRRMNAWGTVGCRLPHNRRTILEKLRASAKQVPWRRKLSAARAARRLGVKLRWLDPAGSLLDEALRRAEDNSRGD